MQKCFYNKQVDGTEVELLEVYDSYGEKWVKFEDEWEEQHDVTLDDFEEMIGEQI